MSYRHSLLHFKLARRAWWERRGEQPIATTLSRQSYRPGSYYWNGNHCYQITRCVWAPDHQCLEVWGREIQRTRLPG